MLFSTTAMSQYYLRGEIKNDQNQPLARARILVQSNKGYIYSDETNGSFGISLKSLYDTLIIYLDGYEIKTVAVKTDVWQKIILKSTIDGSSHSSPKLTSYSSGYYQQEAAQSSNQEETYFKLIENNYIDVSQNTNTSFSLNVNKASYSNVRRFLKMGSEVPMDAVKVEEMVNYFNLHERTPDVGKDFYVESQLTNCPWNEKKQLLFLNVNAKKIDLKNVPPGNFVFLIDVSGSMDMPNRLPLIKAAFQLFVKNLRSVDTVSIVTYGGFVQVWLPPTSGDQKTKILKSIELLEAEGDTPGESAIRLAYTVAQKSFIKDGSNRVILATDGDFNVGEYSEKSMDDLVTKERQSGVYLTCLGVGMGNLKDSKLQTLAKKGNGNYAYLDDINEAERVLIKELTQTLYTVADDALMNVNFNPSYVNQYRLIGFDNKKQALQINHSEIEGGEMGSGSSVIAIFEITPSVKSNSDSNNNKNIASLKLTYKKDHDTTKHTVNYDCNYNFKLIDNIDKDFQFASAVAWFGLKLRNSKYLYDTDWDNLDFFCKKKTDQHNYLQKEFYKLVKDAIKISNGNRVRKKFLFF